MARWLNFVMGSSVKLTMTFTLVFLTTLWYLSLFPNRTQAISVFTRRNPFFHISPPNEPKVERFIQIPSPAGATASEEDYSNLRDSEAHNKRSRGHDRQIESNLKIPEKHQVLDVISEDDPQIPDAHRQRSDTLYQSGPFKVEDDEFNDDDHESFALFARKIDEYPDGGDEVNKNSNQKSHKLSSYSRTSPQYQTSSRVGNLEHFKNVWNDIFNDADDVGGSGEEEDHGEFPQDINEAFQDLFPMATKLSGLPMQSDDYTHSSNSDDHSRILPRDSQDAVDPEMYRVQRTEKGYIVYEDYVKWCYEIRSFQPLYDRFGNAIPSPDAENHPFVLVPEDMNPYTGYSFTEVCQTAVGASLSGGRANLLTPYLFAHVENDTYEIYRLRGTQVDAPAYPYNAGKEFRSFWTILHLPQWLDCPDYPQRQETIPLTVPFSPGVTKLVPYLMTRKGGLGLGHEFRLFQITKESVLHPSPPNGEDRFKYYYSVLYLPEGIPAKRFFDEEAYERGRFVSMQEYITCLELPPQNYWNERWRRTFGLPPLEDREYRRIYHRRVDIRPGFEEDNGVVSYGPAKVQKRAQPSRAQPRPDFSTSRNRQGQTPYNILDDPEDRGKSGKECRETKPRPILYVHEHDNLYSAIFLPVLPAYDPFLDPDGKRYKRLYVVLYQPPCTYHRHDDGSSINEEYFYNTPAVTLGCPKCDCQRKRSVPLRCGCEGEETTWGSGCMCPKTPEIVKRDEIAKTETEVGNTRAIEEGRKASFQRREATPVSNAEAIPEPKKGMKGKDTGKKSKISAGVKPNLNSIAQGSGSKKQSFQKMGSGWEPYRIKRATAEDSEYSDMDGVNGREL